MLFISFRYLYNEQCYASLSTKHRSLRITFENRSNMYTSVYVTFSTDLSFLILSGKMSIIQPITEISIPSRRHIRDRRIIYRLKRFHRNFLKRKYVFWGVFRITPSVFGSKTLFVAFVRLFLDELSLRNTNMWKQAILSVVRMYVFQNRTRKSHIFLTVCTFLPKYGEIWFSQIFSRRPNRLRDSLLRQICSSYG